MFEFFGPSSPHMIFREREWIFEQLKSLNMTMIYDMGGKMFEKTWTSILMDTNNHQTSGSFVKTIIQNL